MKKNKEKLIKLYESMVMVRKFEEKTKVLFNEGLIRGPFHPGIGQEAIPVAGCTQLRKDDYITTHHRAHGHCLAKGGEPNKMMAELLGKATGYCKGKGGSMHIADLDLGILGANGIVGGGFTVANGAALSSKMKGTDQVTVCFFGDGASNQGTFNEGLNLASIWDLPVVFVCENNGYGLTSRAEEVLSVENVADRAAGYNIPGVVVDGNDVLAVYEAVEDAVEKARKGEGPTLIECKTYRTEGHFVGDPNRYRTQDEIKTWRKRCPIEGFKEYLIANDYSTEEELSKLNQKVQQIIDEAEDYARKSPEPAVEDLENDLFVRGE